jgi:hypothetical protein
VLRRLLVGSSLLLLLGPAPGGAAPSYQFTDAEGVTHFTNAPTDPRYRRIAGMSGTAVGWLRIPEATRIRYADEIQAAASRHGVNQALVRSVIRVESAFNPWAVSPKGAQGLMQLMPQTASSLGVRDAFNPRQNIDGGVRHLRYLIDQFPGNLSLALAAYNAGENAVHAYRGIPPYAETEAYVRKVLDLAGDSRGSTPSAIYRTEDAEGTVTYSNVPPPSRPRIR